jgi:hypothetical protein
MKRYRLLANLFLDTRRNILKSEVKNHPYEATTEKELLDAFGHATLMPNLKGL